MRTNTDGTEASSASTRKAASIFYEKLFCGDADAEALYDRIMRAWRDDANLRETEKAVTDVFSKYHGISCISHEIIKISVINQTYATRVRTIDTYGLAELILDRRDGIEAALKNGSAEAVKLIANSENSGKCTQNHYSFATKYCSFCAPDKFPIVDSFLVEFVRECAKRGTMAKEMPYDDYGNFEKYDKYQECMGNLKKIVEAHLHRELTFKELDQFLWKGIKDCMDQ